MIQNIFLYLENMYFCGKYISYMEALEFSTKIEQGMIRLPEQFHEYDNSFVRIIILSDKPRNFSTKKERLMTVLKAMQKKDIFSSITNPVEWQKQQRNEWE